MRVNSLAELRRLRYLQQGKVVEMSDGFFSQGALSALENGKIPCNEKRVIEIATVLSRIYKVKMSPEAFRRLQRREAVELEEIKETVEVPEVAKVGEAVCL